MELVVRSSPITPGPEVELDAPMMPVPPSARIPAPTAWAWIADELRPAAITSSELSDVPATSVVEDRPRRAFVALSNQQWVAVIRARSASLAPDSARDGDADSTHKSGENRSARLLAHTRCVRHAPPFPVNPGKIGIFRRTGQASERLCARCRATPGGFDIGWEMRL
jgi:hypothetical protein